MNVRKSTFHFDITFHFSLNLNDDVLIYEFMIYWDIGNEKERERERERERSGMMDDKMIKTKSFE